MICRDRDYLDSHDLHVHDGHPTMTHETTIARGENQRKQQTKWYVDVCLYADDPDTVPWGEDVLDCFQLGEKCNGGYSELVLEESLVGNFSSNYPRLDNTDAWLIELVTPFVLESDYLLTSFPLRTSESATTTVSPSIWYSPG